MSLNDHNINTNDENGNEGRKDIEPFPSTSKDPATISHKMNDLTAFDLNSADDVR